MHATQRLGKLASTLPILRLCVCRVYVFASAALALRTTAILYILCHSFYIARAYDSCNKQKSCDLKFHCGTKLIRQVYKKLIVCTFVYV